ncbi:5-methyltetrahydropteroyltriglutamate--homocysteine methyltransferase 1-like isoform X2 [Cannabis sativa]|uniref:5-methyltetrahydropteroyltriglutamate-- homocysteine methyltransferase 1-like isoform X2 n=1 Tax=Cannabis sativa TaxID=3483 RepID=UPI0029C9DF17|nr:5-methyltetrahydropteroyltriglutamate--homocysteine methyltransferase 1-like isoform X2 [Cannabis sativa]
MLSYSPLLISLHNRLRDTKKPLFPSPPRNPLTGGGAVASSSKIMYLGLDTVPVLVGPVSYLLLSKPAKGVEKSFSLLSLIGNILSVYKEVVAELKAAGATWIQFDEPTLVKDLDSHQLQAFTHAYSELESSLSGLNVIIESYFADVPAEAYKTLTSLKGVAGYGFDLVCGTKILDLIKSGFPSGKYLFAGVVDGRNIWANDLASSISTLEALEGIVGKDKVVVSTSCSLLHTAVDLVNETKLDAEIKSWLAFAAQKVVEVNALAKAFFAANAAAQASRKSSTRVTNEHVQKSAAALKGSDNRRATNVSVRLDAQQKKLSLPVLPTTTIGSFPQTMDLRRVRREYKAKKGMICLSTLESNYLALPSLSMGGFSLMDLAVSSHLSSMVMSVAPRP